MRKITDLFNESTSNSGYSKSIIGLCEKIRDILNEAGLSVELDLDGLNPEFEIFDPKSRSKDTLVLSGALSPKRHN